MAYVGMLGDNGCTAVNIQKLLKYVYFKWVTLTVCEIINTDTKLKRGNTSEYKGKSINLVKNAQQVHFFF